MLQSSIQDDRVQGNNDILLRYKIDNFQIELDQRYNNEHQIYSIGGTISDRKESINDILFFNQQQNINRIIYERLKEINISVKYTVDGIFFDNGIYVITAGRENEIRFYCYDLLHCDSNDAIQYDFQILLLALPTIIGVLRYYDDNPQNLRNDLRNNHGKSWITCKILPPYVNATQTRVVIELVQEWLDAVKNDFTNPNYNVNKVKPL